jgi:hypothetical protein
VLVTVQFNELHRLKIYVINVSCKQRLTDTKQEGNIVSSFYITSKNLEVLIKLDKESKAVPLHAMKALGGRGGIAPTLSRPRN